MVHVINGTGVHRRKEGAVPELECSSRVLPYSLIFSHPAAVSFQMITLWSWEQDASIEPNDGWAHETIHTGPSCLHHSAATLAVASPFFGGNTRRSAQNYQTQQNLKERPPAKRMPRSGRVRRGGGPSQFLH